MNNTMKYGDEIRFDPINGSLLGVDGNDGLTMDVNYEKSLDNISVKSKTNDSIKKVRQNK